MKIQQLFTQAADAEAHTYSALELYLNPGSPSGWSSHREGISEDYNPDSYTRNVTGKSRELRLLEFPFFVVDRQELDTFEANPSAHLQRFFAQTDEETDYMRMGVGHRLSRHYNGLKNGTDDGHVYPLNSSIRCSDPGQRNDGHAYSLNSPIRCSDPGQRDDMTFDYRKEDLVAQVRSQFHTILGELQAILPKGRWYRRSDGMEYDNRGRIRLVPGEGAPLLRE